MTPRSRSRPSQGVVTFLDVLGWKGIWARNREAVNTLRDLVANLESLAPKFARGRGGDIPLQTTTLSISDTIVFATPTAEETAVDALSIHGALSAEAIKRSLSAGMPLRGATAFGDYELNREAHILVGPCVDEAASWHERGDWIGVFMSPSAAFLFAGQERSRWWMKQEPPLKGSQKLDTFAVKWADREQLPEIRRLFLRMSPILPEVAEKFGNTLGFLEKIDPYEPSRTMATGTTANLTTPAQGAVDDRTP